MSKKSFLAFVGVAALILMGAGCGVPGEKDVINGSYLDRTKAPVSVPAQPTPTSTTSSVK